MGRNLSLEAQLPIVTTFSKRVKMKIFLMGASGMVGSRILAEAVARGHEVIAGARNPDRIADLPGVTRLKLEGTDAEALREAAKGADVYVSALSPRSTADAVTEAKSYAEALIKAAAGKRVLMVGGAGSLSLPDGTPVVDILPPEYVNEARGMKAAWGLLEASGLEWTILAPSAEIAPGAKTGSYHVGGTTLLSDTQGRSHISAEDFADAVVTEVESPRFPRQLATVGYTA